MKQEFLCKIVFLISLGLFSISSFAQFSATNIDNESFDASEIDEINVENKYGDVNVSMHDASTIDIQYELSAHKKTEKHAKELLSRLDFKMKTFGNELNLTLNLEKSKRSILDQIFSHIETGDDKSDVNINLDIKVPKELALNITNEFGNIYIEDWGGTLKCNLRHGNIRVSNDLKRLKITHSYGKGSFKNIGLATLELRNVEFSADEIKELELESKGSELEIETLNKLNLDSKRDDIRIQKLDHISGDLNYSSTVLKEMGKHLILNMKISDLRIDKISVESPDYFIEQNNSDVDINITDASFLVKATMERGTFRIPDEAEGMDAELLDEEKEKRIITGTYGKGAKGNLTIKGRKGFILLRQL